ncbi:MAG: heme NO-binding domain-containing protein [Bacteroidia bacterium]
MYGIIYVAIKDYTEATFSAEIWQSVLEKSSLSVNLNSTELPYNEDKIINFAEATAAVTGISISDALFGMGSYVPETTSKKYPEVMLSRGDSLKEYLLNLPAFHNRISLIYPELTAPEFRITAVNDNSITIQYLYKRKDITPYVHGYLSGIAKYFDKNGKVCIVPEAEQSRYIAFNISW